MEVTPTIYPCNYCGSKIKAYKLSNNDLGKYYSKEISICLSCVKKLVSEISSQEQMKHLTGK